jgi:hypothetical protein
MDRPLPIVAYLDTNIFHEIVESDSRGDGLQQRCNAVERRARSLSQPVS